MSVRPALYKTVLVLGAGASHDLKIPLGNSLLDYIISNNRNGNFTKVIKRIIYNNRIAIHERGLLDQLPKPIAESIKLNNSSQILRQTDDSYTDWTKDLHHVESIDQFIHHRKELAILAKLSILITLSEFENPDMFDHFNLGNPVGKGPSHGVRRTWYNALWNNIISHNPSFDEVKQVLAQMHFVTFNYDRSLEYFLLKSIKALYPHAEIKSTDLPITHIYGCLGSLDPEASNYREYKKIMYSHSLEPGQPGAQEYHIEHSSHNANVFKVADEKLFNLALGIDTYGKVYDSTKSEAIQAMIRNAEDVYIFGFSFQHQNMDILFQQTSTPIAKGKVNGTCYDMPKEKLDDVRFKLWRYFAQKNEDYLFEPWRTKTIGDFFKDFSIRMPKVNAKA